jgi:hypothetical protein
MPEIVRREPQTENPPDPRVPEVVRLRLQNLFLQQQVCREQLNVLTLQFLQTGPPKVIQDRIEELTRRINSIAQQIFTDARLDSSRYQFDVDSGTFVERL